MEINEKLKKYIETYVFPVYEKNEKAHGIKHIEQVIRRSFKLAEDNKLDVNPDIVYTVAAYHDIGHHIDPKTHEVVSAAMMYNDNGLREFFNEEDMKTIMEAIEDHRASNEDEPRSIYGRIVSSADRNTSVEACLFRSYSYGKKLAPDATDEELFERAHFHLNKKFGEGGYAKFFFKDEEYEQFLKDIRKLLKNKKKFIDTQRKYIEDLKEKGEL